TNLGGHIWLTAERQGKDVIVSVRDNGIGIPAEALPKIFDMFSQVDRGIERAVGGLGIGLALVKGLLEMQGGTVSVEGGGPGSGSTFTVRLPALESHLQPAIPERTAERPLAIGPNRRILIADDNRDAASSLARVLKLIGNEVRTASDGIEVAEAAAEFRP